MVVDQGVNNVVFVSGVFDFQFGCVCYQFGQKFVIDIFMDQYFFDVYVDLFLVYKGVKVCGLCCVFYIGVVQNDQVVFVV